MKFALVTAAIAGTASLFTGAFALPQPAAANTSVAKSGVLPSFTGPVPINTFVESVKNELQSTTNQLHLSKREAQDSEQAVTVANNLTDFFSNWHDTFQKSGSISLTSLTSEYIVPFLLTITHDLVVIVIYLIKDLPNDLKLVSKLLELVSSLLGVIGKDVDASLPELSGLFGPVFHLLSALVLAIANAIYPVPGFHALFTPKAILGKSASSILSNL